MNKCFSLIVLRNNYLRLWTSGFWSSGLWPGFLEFGLVSCDQLLGDGISDIQIVTVGPLVAIFLADGHSKVHLTIDRNRVSGHHPLLLQIIGVNLTELSQKWWAHHSLHPLRENFAPHVLLIGRATMECQVVVKILTIKVEEKVSKRRIIVDVDALKVHLLDVFPARTGVDHLFTIEVRHLDLGHFHLIQSIVLDCLAKGKETCDSKYHFNFN